MRQIYLDHTATTPLDPRAFEAMRPYFADTFGNASSVHRFGQRARFALEQARERIAFCIGSTVGELFFTSGGTESNNFAIRGIATAARKNGKTHLITSSVEHHSVLETCEMFQKEGYSVTVLPVDEHGVVDPLLVREAISDETALVSVMHSNNEVGSISSIKEIVDIAHSKRVPMHCDAVQSLGKVPLDVEDLGIDLLTLSAHKTYGPKGIGALFIRKGIEIDALLHGGGQERGRRPGTENVPLAVGFAVAAEHSCKDLPEESRRIQEMRNLLEERIRSEFPAAIINGHPTNRLPHILNISFDSAKLPLEGEMLLMTMDLQGIAVTSGSACTSGSMQPSHVLLAMGRDPHTAKATLRFAFGRGNQIEDVSVVVDALHVAIRKMSAAPTL
jgi:cysteine desulfurase